MEEQPKATGGHLQNLPMLEGENGCTFRIPSNPKFVVSDTTRQAINKLHQTSLVEAKNAEDWDSLVKINDEFVEQVIALLERQD